MAPAALPTHVAAVAATVVGEMVTVVGPATESVVTAKVVPFRLAPMPPAMVAQVLPSAVAAVAGLLAGARLMACAPPAPLTVTVKAVVSRLLVP